MLKIHFHGDNYEMSSVNLRHLHLMIEKQKAFDENNNEPINKDQAVYLEFTGSVKYKKRSHWIRLHHYFFNNTFENI